MTYLDRLAERLRALERSGLRRVVPERSDAGTSLDFSSNDYLGLAEHPAVVAALRSARRVGSGGSRLLAGSHVAHRALERELAAYCGRERALLFTSGYHAALGAIGALACAVDGVFSDALNHASLIDGIRGTRLERRIYPHGAFGGAVRAAAFASGALVVSESLFGMDGDAVDVRAMRAALGPNDVLLLDEAHALGIIGEHGGGLAHGIDDPRIVVLGTLSKAFGALGGFIAGPATVIDYLQTAARTFIFDSALPPAVAEAARAGVALAFGCERERRRLAVLGERLRSGLRSLGYAAPEAAGPIVPVPVGGAQPTLALAARLRGLGINAPAIRPPTVPPGTSRLRITLRATHESADVDRLLAALRET